MTREVEFFVSSSVVSLLHSWGYDGGSLINGGVGGGGGAGLGGVPECGAEGVEGGCEAGGLVLAELVPLPVVVGVLFLPAVVLEDLRVEGSLARRAGGVVLGACPDTTCT